MRAETRHQLKQDRFSQATFGAAEATVYWTVEHKTKLIAGAVVIAVVLAASFGGWYYLNQQDQKARPDLADGNAVNLDASLADALNYQAHCQTANKPVFRCEGLLPDSASRASCNVRSDKLPAPRRTSASLHRHKSTIA